MTTLVIRSQGKIMFFIVLRTHDHDYLSHVQPAELCQRPIVFLLQIY